MGNIQANFEEFVNGTSYYKISSPTSPNVYRMGINLDKNAKISGWFYYPPNQGVTKSRNDSVFQIVHTLNTRKELDKIYTLFSPSFQKAVPIDKFKSDWSNLVLPKELDKNQLDYFDGAYNRYKVYSGKDSLGMSIAVHSDGLINGFGFGPYSKPILDTVITSKP